MVELRSDLARKVSFDHASSVAHTEEVRDPNDGLMAQHARMCEAAAKPKRKKKVPWVTIITVLSFIPMFFMNGMPGLDQMLAGVKNSPQQIAQAVKNRPGVLGNSNETTNVTVSVGGQTFTQAVPVADINALQKSIK